MKYKKKETQNMELLVDDVKAQTSFFDAFIKSTVIEEIIEDINVTLGIDVAIIDSDGVVLLTPTFFNTSAPEIVEEFKEFINKNIKDIDDLNSPCPCQFLDSSNLCFISAPVYSREERSNLGYLIGGPYYYTPSPLSKSGIIKNLNRIIGKDSGMESSLQTMTPAMQNVIVRTLDSYGRMIALLYEEKLKGTPELQQTFRTLPDKHFNFKNS
jgi:hypothetical protein